MRARGWQDAPEPLPRVGLAVMMNDWIDVADAADCPPGTIIERVAGGGMVAIANVEGALHAIDGLCPHQGGPLGRGTLCGAVLTCPWHGWQFDVTTGRHRLSSTVRQPRYEVRVEAGRIQVRPAEDAPGPEPTA